MIVGRQNVTLAGITPTPLWGVMVVIKSELKTAQTEMSPDQNGPDRIGSDRIGQIEKPHTPPSIVCFS